MQERKRILVVEDEPDLRDAVVDYLAARELEAAGVGDGAAMRAAVAAREPDVVVLDIALPGEDGLSLCRWLRRETTAGIILATGAGKPLDRVVGFETGADDYVVKPYDLRELLARVRSVTRRVTATALPERRTEAPKASRSPAEPFGPYGLDRSGRRLLDADGAEIKLTAIEFALVTIFADRANRPLPRSLLGELVHGRSVDPADRSIDISIMRLRRKLEREGAPAELIRTVRGQGYQFDAAAR